MQQPIITIKVDVDTDRGTRMGVPNLLNLFSEFDIKATFLFSLGPDNTGRALKRIFRPGFLKKVSRSSVISTYGIRTLLNGVLLPGPHIGKRNQAIMQHTHQAGHEVGIHCYDHIRWQDGLATMSSAEVSAEFNKAASEFKRIFGFDSKTAGAAGWQANALSLETYDQAQLLYGSDARGTHAFFPRMNGKVYNTLQIPTSLPTLDELLGRPEYPMDKLADFYFYRLVNHTPNVYTIHAEVEGMKHLVWFRQFLKKARERNIQFTTMETIAKQLLASAETIPTCDLVQGFVDGRSGTLAVQQ